MFTAMRNYLVGNLTDEEVKKFSLLGVIFFFLIGTYWLLRTQKDAVFKSIIGFEHQPKAKIISLLVVLMIIPLYSKLVDIWPKRRVLMSFALTYCLSFSVIAFFLHHPTIGLDNTNTSPWRFFGWFVYVFIETFGSIMPGLFWAFVNSSVDTETAKKGYPLIIAGAQTGSILGSFLSWKSAWFGSGLLFYLGGFGVFAIIPSVLFYLYMVPTEPSTVRDAGKPKTGMFEGLKILLTRPYVLGIFALATLYEVVATILDFQMKLLGSQVYPNHNDFASFNGLYGVMVNTLALFFAVFGTRFFLQRFGLRFCLMFFPVATGCVVSMVYLNRTFVVVTLAVMIIKSLSYALNNPAKEMMYIPTTKDVKFKAKGWVDMFGSRSSKGAGSGANWVLQAFTNDIMLYGTLMSLGIVGVWFVAATFVGSTFDRLVKNKEVVS